jgi:hypothetical protein
MSSLFPPPTSDLCSMRYSSLIHNNSGWMYHTWAVTYLLFGNWDSVGLLVWNNASYREISKIVDGKAILIRGW